MAGTAKDKPPAAGRGRATYAAALIVAAAAVLAAGAIYGSPQTGVAAPTASSAPAREHEPIQPTKVQPVAEAADPATKPAHEPASTAAADPEASAELQDDNPSCTAWAASGECVRNPGFMKSSCAKSCAGHPVEPAQEAAGAAAAAHEPREPKVVDWSRPVLAAELEAAQAETDAAHAAGTLPALSSRCSDARPDCAALARWNLSACGEAPFMLTQCRATCRTCGHDALVGELAICKDRHEGCSGWAASGECEANKRYMLSACSEACGVCAQKQFACARRNPVPGVTSPAGLMEMFAAAQRDFPQYAPTLLSSDPPILQFDGLISPEEAAAMIAITGDKLVPSLAGDQLSPVRTSTQYWCDDSDGCTDNKTVKAITRRMSEIARMPEDNAEYFQILRYEPGQFYKAHHDQQTAHWTPQGVRVYTFFVYLSDVEAGGGTRFVDLGLTVTPKLGRAILWPSVIAADLLTGEKKTHHEALPVEAGLKYAANLWIHLYDFKSPSRAGACPFLGSNTHGGD